MKLISYIVIVSISLALVGCESMFFEADPKNNPEALFESFWTTFDTDFANFEERGIDWDARYHTYRPMVNQNTTDEELYNIMKELISVLGDTHIKFTVPGKTVYTPNPYHGERIEDELFDLGLIKSNYLTEEVKEYDDGYLVQSRIDNIGYLWFKGIGTNFLSIDDVLDQFNDVDGLILDLRHNGGGDFTYAYSEMGRFTSEERYVNSSRTKNGKGKDDFTQWYDWSIHPATPYFDKSLVMLTDRYTVSAGERATMAFMTLPNLVHMGDSTNVCISTMIGRELINGWYFSVTPRR